MSADFLVSDREKKNADLSLDKISEDGRFSGYASLYNIADLSNDIVNKGAFSSSLKRHEKRPVRMLFQHDPDQPIGHWTKLIENEKGLYVEGQLTLDVERAKDVYALIKSGALDGLSIGFKTIRSRKCNKTGARHILEADLWEISIVTFPMLPSARVDDVKFSNADPSHFEAQLALKIRDAAARV